MNGVPASSKIEVFLEILGTFGRDWSQKEEHSPSSTASVHLVLLYVAVINFLQEFVEPMLLVAGTDGS